MLIRHREVPCTYNVYIMCLCICYFCLLLFSTIIPSLPFNFKQLLFSLCVYSGSPTSCQIRQWLQCSPPWLLMSGLSSHFFYYSVFSLLLSEASVTEILSKWLQDFNSLGNHCVCVCVCVCLCLCMCPYKLFLSLSMGNIM